MFTWRRKKKTIVRKKPKISAPRSLLKKQIIVASILCLVIGSLVIAVWHGTRLESFQVKEIRVVGGFTIAHTAIEDIARRQLVGTYFKLIPKRFTFFYPGKEIENEILRIDRVKSAHVELDDSNNVRIVFKEYKPYALWCADVESQNCVFIDVEGYSFSKAPPLTGSAFVRYVGKNSEPQLAVHYFSKEFIRETKTFSEKLEKELLLFVTHVHTFGDYDIEYSISGGGKIKVSQTMSMDVSFDNLKTILTSEEFLHLSPGDFQYIDLRFGDKVFVNEVTESTATTTTATSSVQE